MAIVTNSSDSEPQVISTIQQANQTQLVTPAQPASLLSFPPPQKEYLVLSIVSLFFFIVLAVPALLFSIKTRDANFLGDERKAQRYSRLALGFGISSILVGTIMLVSTLAIKVMKHKV